MATFWERPVHSVDHRYSLCILTICNFAYISVLVLRAEIRVLIAPVPGHCILVTCVVTSSK